MSENNQRGLPPPSSPPEPEDKTGLTNVIERRLVTILSADVAGYSKLMAEHEEHTLKLFRQHKKVFEQLVQLHGGRIFNTAGDAILAEFSSAVEGVRCATEIQSALRTRNEKFVEHLQVRFRIGVNLGDVIVQGTDLLGDGVNLAARVQTAAEPGGVCIAGSVWDQVQNKLSLNVNPLGEVSYKNIPNPVRTFSVVVEKGGFLHAGVATTTAKPKPPFRGAPFFAAAGAACIVLAAAVYFVAKGGSSRPAQTAAQGDPASLAVTNAPASKDETQLVMPLPVASQEQKAPEKVAEKPTTAGAKYYKVAAPSIARAWLAPKGKAPATWIVAPGQASGNARPTIAEAVAAASPGDVIEIRPGVYRETFLLDKKITLRGQPGEGGMLGVRIEAEGREAINVIEGIATLENLFIYVHSEDKMNAAAAVLVSGGEARLYNVVAFASGASGSSGFSLRAGSASVFASEFGGVRGLEQMGGKLECEDCVTSGAEEEGVVVMNQGNEPAFRSVFRNLKVTGAKTTGFVIMANAKATVEGCEIDKNAVNGAMILANGFGNFSKCSFSDNMENGFVVAETGRAEVRKSKANRNTYSGFAAVAKGQIEVSDSEIMLNGEFGVASLNESIIKDTDNKISGNRGGRAWRAPASEK